MILIPSFSPSASLSLGTFAHGLRPVSLKTPRCGVFLALNPRQEEVTHTNGYLPLSGEVVSKANRRGSSKVFCSMILHFFLKNRQYPIFLHSSFFISSGSISSR